MTKIAKQTTTATTTNRVAWWADRLSILGFFEITPKEALGVLVVLGLGTYSAQLPWYRSLLSGPPPAPISGPAATSPPSNDQIRMACREQVVGHMEWISNPALAQPWAVFDALDNCEQRMRLSHVERDQK